MHETLSRCWLHRYGMASGSAILGAVVLRVVLIGSGWPPTNSDEGTMGLMALHIAYRGEHPVFVYGQPYMGALEAYLGAAWFKIFGVSLFGLRIGLVGMYALFLALLYAIICRVYTRSLAVLSLVVLSLGSVEMLYRQTEAGGGYMEMLCCATALFLLALLARRTATPRRQMTLYALWGAIAGIGFWSELLILPWLAGAGLLLAWDWLRHRRGLAALMLVLGLSVGAFPAIHFYLTSPENTSVEVVHQAIASVLADQSTSLGQQLLGTVLVSLPVATGGTTLCSMPPEDFWPLDARSSVRTILCTATHGLWGIGVILMGSIAVWSEVSALQRIRLVAKGQPDDMLPSVARLALLGGGAITLMAYALTPYPAHTPWASSRYLTGLLIAVPALLWPLWRSIASANQRRHALHVSAAFVSLGGICFVLMLGTANTLRSLSGIAQTNEQKTQLITQLQELHATRIYADYWTCNWVMFLSREQIICGVLNDQLRTGRNRYPAYLNIVQSAAHPAYVFPAGSPQSALMDRRAVAHRITTAKYIIYLSS
jgi:hypothetical protein